MLRQVVLAGGIASSLLYVAEDVLAGSRWVGYDFTSRAFGDYSTSGAPTRSLILALSPVYSLLVIAFGLGVWWSVDRWRALRAVGALLVLYALVSWVWPQFHPIHLNAAQADASDLMYTVLTVVSVLS
jgi:hypothetical protein